MLPGVIIASFSGAIPGERPAIEGGSSSGSRRSSEVAPPIRFALLLVLLLALPGCGTLLGHHGFQEVQVITDPAGAQLYVDGVATPVRSPGAIALDPAEEHRVDARLHGLRGGTQVRRKVRIVVAIVDCILTGGLGLTVDYFSGALYEFPAHVVLNLGQAAPVPSQAEVEYPPPDPQPDAPPTR